MPKLPNTKTTRTPRDSIALASHPHYRDHKLQIATSGPTAGQPKRVKVDPTRQATRKQITGAYEAWRFADRQGIRLNTWITVIFDQLHGPRGWQPGKPARDQVPAQRRRLIQSLADWCRAQGIPQSWLYVMENVPGRGPHIHILMHLPEDAPPAPFVVDGETAHPDPTWHAHRSILFARLLAFTGYTQAEFDAAPSGIRPIDVLATHLPNDHGHDSAMAKLRYIVKTASPNMLIEHEGKRMTILELLSDDNGEPSVTLKPSADTYTERMIVASALIGPGARKTAGWVDGNSDPIWMSRKIAKKARLEMIMTMIKPLMTLSSVPV